MNIEYAALMSQRLPGKALYNPQEYSIMHPGVCGYFDANGEWNRIINLMESDQDSWQKWNLKPPRANLEFHSTHTQKSEPIETETKTNPRVRLSAGLSIPAGGLPFKLSANAKADVEVTGKAVLNIPEKTRHHIDSSICDGIIDDWVGSNVPGRLGLKSTGDSGLWVVTQVWTTPEYEILLQSQQGSNMQTDADVDVAGAASAGGGFGKSLEGNNQKGGSWKAEREGRGLPRFAFEGYWYKPRFRDHFMSQVYVTIG